MAAYALRKAAPSDAEALLAIENESFQVDRIKLRQMQYLLTKAKASTWVFEIESLTEVQRSSESQHQIVGYCTIFLPKLPRPARIYSLAVHPDHRGQGVSRRLVEAALGEAQNQGYSCIRLEVGEANKTAQRLYCSLGFQIVERLPYYYEDKSHGIRMELRMH